MALLLNDIYNFLAIKVGNSTGWLTYKGFMPDEQDQCVGIFETPGLPATDMERDNETVAFQIRVRGSRWDYEAVHRKWENIFDALQDSLPAPHYYLCQCEQYGPMVFYDPNGRVNMTTGFRVIRAHFLSME